MNIAYSYKQQKSSETIAAAHSMAQRHAVSLVDYRMGSVVQRQLRDAMNSHTHTVSQNVFQFKSNNTGLPNNLKTGIENLSGHSMDDVKVHYHSSKPAQLNAHAYAQGNQIHVAPGQEKHLPHEAWHVVQQKQGRVRPTMQMKGKVNVNDNKGLEHEADVMGAKAMSMGFVAQRSGTGRAHYHYSPVAQLRHRTEISYQQGRLGWRGNNHAGGATHHETAGIGTTAFLDPQDPVQGEVTGAAPAGTIYTIGGGHIAAQNGGAALTQGHLLNANLGGKAQPFNLFPITAEMNRAHSDIVEDPVKNMLLRVHHERTQEGSLLAAPFVPAAGLPTGAGRAASQVPPVLENARVTAVMWGVNAAIFGFYGGLGLPAGMGAALFGVPGDNVAFYVTRILNAAAAAPGATAANVALLANAIAAPVGGVVGPLLTGALAAAGAAFTAPAAAGILVAAIGGGAPTPPGEAGTYTAGPNDIYSAFRHTPAAGVSAAGLSPMGAAYNWDKVRVFYSVRVTSPGVKGAVVMRPNNLRQERFDCEAYFTTQDGITPDYGLPHINTPIQVPHTLNTSLAALGFAPTARMAGVYIGAPAVVAGGAPVAGGHIAPGGGVAGAGVLGAPSQHNIYDAAHNIIGRATLFNHG